jgi:hypothetical protein
MRSDVRLSFGPGVCVRSDLAGTLTAPEAT